MLKLKIDSVVFVMRLRQRIKASSWSVITPNLRPLHEKSQEFIPKRGGKA